ncbi:uncharacterized protein LOC132385341 [Hypanus sabinus]|uniref:uncharacterized protein LOC132385341 n=1 Tax=Hypanus sabinus TaxID=79690 RepID=UPI0028C3C14B|nr:uncharacterized protein LOC132385341 [Hypanus sabinus]
MIYLSTSLDCARNPELLNNGRCLSLKMSWSLAVSVLVMTVGSVLGQQGTCDLIPNTSSFSCPCLPSGAQSLHLHNLAGVFRDNCSRGEGNGLCCQNATQARVDADRVVLNYSWVIPRTIYCEISTSGMECPRQRTPVDQLSTPPKVTSRKPVTTRTDRREVEDTTTRVRVSIVIPVVLVVLIGVLVLILRWQRGRRSVEMETHREIPLSAVLIPQAAHPSGLPSASDTPEESAPTRPITPHD